MNSESRSSGFPVLAPQISTVRMLTPDGVFAPNDAAEPFVGVLEQIGDEEYRRFYRDMARSRRLDEEASNLQRQGQLALWPPSLGQEAAQVGSARAATDADHLFPSYREHAAAFVRGVPPVDVVSTFRGVNHAGWKPSDPGIRNFHIYTFVVGAQTLHATGYAMGIGLDAASSERELSEAAMVYFGDGSTSQGDVNEALVFAASYQTPQVFFLQNNHWAISVPVTRQSRVPLAQRAVGFGIPSVQVDGNDVLAVFAVTSAALAAARSGGGPQFVEALTYRLGAHTTADDPTKYRTDAELSEWGHRDPLLRFRLFLQSRGVEAAFFDEVDAEVAAEADALRQAIIALAAPEPQLIFDAVYSEPHTLLDEQRAWLTAYEASFEAADADGAGDGGAKGIS